jgi:hypothetical protein
VSRTEADKLCGRTFSDAELLAPMRNSLSVTAIRK